MFAKGGREQKRERARARWEQADSVSDFFFFLHIHTTGKNHQHQSSLGARQTTSKARIGSTHSPERQRETFLLGRLHSQGS